MSRRGLRAWLVGAALLPCAAYAQTVPPILLPPVPGAQRPPLAPPPPEARPLAPEGERTTPPRDEQDDRAERRRRPPVAGLALPRMPSLEADAFSEPIDEPVTSSGNYELWMSTNAPPPPDRPQFSGASRR